MTESIVSYKTRGLERRILTIRGQRVILDADLALVYGVATKRFNEQVRRNTSRFPKDFMFRLTLRELSNLRSQIATSRAQPFDKDDNILNWSQIATSSQKLHGGLRYRPLAFTEHGAIMAANVLNSERAVRMSVFVVRAFVKIRREMIARTELEKRLLQVESLLLAHDGRIRDLYDKIRPLLLPPDYPPFRKIGFLAREKRANYRARKQKGG